MATLPRPSRPSIGGGYGQSAGHPPPSGPLPSIPVPKSRQPSSASVTASPNLSSLPQPSNSRTASSSSMYTTSSTPGSSTRDRTSTATLSSQSSNEAKRTLRKTLSYNSFPKPPPGGLSNGSPTSSNSTTPRSSARVSGIVNGASIRSSSLSTGPIARASGIGQPNGDILKSFEGSFDDLSSTRGRDRPHSSSNKDKDKQNVVISVRVRPEKDPKDDAGSAGEWMVDGRKSLISFKGKEGGEYLYDNVFTTHDKNGRVYDAAAKRLVRRVMEGYNGTVFAYGMTGTGKTFTMNGIATSPGVIPLAITDIFSYIRETPHREFLLRVSYLEIYNERIHDLLSPPLPQTNGMPAPPGDEIKLREDSKGNVYASPLKEEIVQSPTQLLRVIARGEAARKVGQTQWNAHSSRSHAVVQIVVESRERNAGSTAIPDSKRVPLVPGGVRVSTLSLIDLAGSERAAETKERRTEGAHINKSLLTLGTVISKLTGAKDKNGMPMDKDGKHLPYRDSKLTRLLQPALAGNSLISILCTIQLGASGSSAVTGSHTIETLNTLKFAARARNNIVSHAKRSEESHGNIGDAGSRALLDRYRAEISELRKQLESKNDSAKTEEVPIKVLSDQEEKAKEAEEQQRHEEQLIEMHLARTALADRIEHLNRLILSSKSTGVNQSRSYSSLSFGGPQRASTVSNATDAGYTRSIRSSASTTTLDANSHSRNSYEPAVTGSSLPNPIFDEDEDLAGVMGDGNATMAAQIRALQSDLADKSRYIEELQRKLAQARRTSRSRTSVFLDATRKGGPEQAGSVEALLREKDAEIAELREKLDDKDRMLGALRSAQRKRETADMTPVATPPPESFTPSLDRRISGNTNGDGVGGASPAATAGARNRRISTVSNASNSTDNQQAVSAAPSSYRSSVTAKRRSSTGPGVSPFPQRASMAVSPLNPSSASLSSTPILSSAPDLASMNRTSPRSPPRKRNHGVDEMTRLLDDMIRQKVEEDAAKGETGRSNSLNLLAMRRGGERKVEGLGIQVQALPGVTAAEGVNGVNGGLGRKIESTTVNGSSPPASSPSPPTMTTQPAVLVPSPTTSSTSPASTSSTPLPHPQPILRASKDRPLSISPFSQISPTPASIAASPPLGYASGSTSAAAAATEALRGFEAEVGAGSSGGE